MSEPTDIVVDVDRSAATLPDGVISFRSIAADVQDGCRVFVHYNGPTAQLSGMCTGMAVLDPGASPHPPHQHPEEEILVIADGTGEIECDGTVTAVGPGSIMFCAGGVLHGIVNTGPVPLTFYWSKWSARPGLPTA